MGYTTTTTTTTTMIWLCVIAHVNFLNFCLFAGNLSPSQLIPKANLTLALSLSLCMLDLLCLYAWPSMGHTTLTNPSQHSKHQERALCVWWPAPPSIFADNLVVSYRCQTVLILVVSWLRDVELGGQEQPDPYAWLGQRVCVSSDL